MNVNRKLKITKIFLLFLILSLVAVVLTSLLLQDKTVPSKELKSYSKLSSGGGISFVETHGDKVVYRLSIDSFSIDRAKLGPFAIGPLIVANLRKVTVDLYREGMESRLESEGKTNEDWTSLDFQAPVSSIRKNLPYKIKTIKFEGVCFNLWEGGKRIFSLSSETAAFDRKTGEVIFTGQVKMDAGENGNLLAHRIRWDRKTGLFKVIDAYLLTQGGRAMEGRGIETDYSLKKMARVIAKN